MKRIRRMASRDRLLLTERRGVSVTLPDAYEHCRQICRHYGTTYYFATQFFPRHTRSAVHALYAWVRYPDEWVDNPGDLTLEQQREKLRHWRDATVDAIKTGRADHPVLLAWADSARRFSVPPELMRDFLVAMEQDISVARYETYTELRRYTWGSASVVGLMMCHLCGSMAPEARAHADSLGTAMQLTNFLRDVGEDWRDRGRIYLPLEDLAEYGVTVEEIANGVVTDRWRKLMRFEICRARRLYCHADAGMHYLPKTALLPVRLARLLYARILDKIEENDYDVFSQRARVPTKEKLSVLAREGLRRNR